ncbi:hypothetical protein HY491_04780 [Candidatus Woesearchaeota archaeon]|nr:hypothetical protein [Candidatus Woesearchaeota archaeon]
MDIIIAVAFGLLLLIIAQGFLSVSRDSLSSLQVSRTGSDIAAALDHQGVLDTLDEDAIAEQLEDMLPVNYQMRLEIKTNGEGEELDIGESLPANREIFSGRRVFAVTDGGEISDYGMVQYFIWVK